MGRETWVERARARGKTRELGTEYPAAVDDRCFPCPASQVETFISWSA